MDRMAKDVAPGTNAVGDVSSSEACDSFCDICCSERPSNSIVRPCHCQTAYCAGCIKKRFAFASASFTMMPPICCKSVILIHYVLPFLSADEASKYRDRFDEWYSPRKLYCPVVWCSTFIPDRLLPPAVKAKDKIIDCPKCAAQICLGCKQLSHVGLPCVDFIDPETRNIISKLGYKHCPSCGHGVRRMFGCNHMQCLCGAHWCWGCRYPIADCEETAECMEDEEYCLDEDQEVDLGRIEILQQTINDGAEIWSSPRGQTYRSWCKAILEDYLVHRHHVYEEDPAILEVESNHVRLQYLLQALELLITETIRDSNCILAIIGNPTLQTIGDYARKEPATAEISDQDATQILVEIAREKSAEAAPAQDPSGEAPPQVLVDHDRRSCEAGMNFVAMNFGAEPVAPAKYYLQCLHSFTNYTIPGTREKEAPLVEKYIECHRCWRTVRAGGTAPSVPRKKLKTSDGHGMLSAPSIAAAAAATSSPSTDPDTEARLCSGCRIIFCAACVTKLQKKTSSWSEE